MERNGSVFDYLRWRGDLTFAQDPFNEVDNLMLCIIAYINFQRIERLRTREPREAMALGEVCSLLTEQDEQLGLSNLGYIPLMRAAAETVRFGAVRMYGYECSHDDEREMQFDAVSFLVPDNSLFVAFMGTDRSLVGWKEDFNMSFLAAVPAQQRAAAYATVMAGTCRRALRIGGHSKGGNLAAWAAMHIPERLQKKRLLAAYNNDGPGFSQSLLETEEYRRIADRMHTYIPESSIVGVLLDHAEDYDVIDSSNRAIMQHEPMSWSVLGNHFVHLGERSQLGKLSDGVLREWIGSMTPEEREDFSNALFEILSQGGKMRTLDELRGGGLAASAALVRSYIGADEKKKQIISELMRRLAVDVGAELKKTAGGGIKAAGQALTGWMK